MFETPGMYAIDHVTGCCLVNIIRRCVSLEAKKYFYLETYLSFDITMCIEQTLRILKLFFIHYFLNGYHAPSI